MWLSPMSLDPHRVLKVTCLGSAMGWLGTWVQVEVLGWSSNGQKAGQGSSAEHALGSGGHL